MPKNKISEWSSTAANNTDIGGIDIAEGCAPSVINNAIREMMAQVKDMQSGTDADNFTVGGNLNVTGTTTATGAITANGGVVGNLTGNVTGNVTGNASTATTATSATTATIATKATNIAGGGAGQVPYNSGADTTEFLAAGTSGQVLQSNGTSAPSWATLNTLTSATAQASTSGTAIDFTSIPSWVQKITIMLRGVSTSGASHKLVQIGNSTPQTTGYISTSSTTSSGAATVSSTAGFIFYTASSADIATLQVVLTKINGNEWVCSGVGKITTANCIYGAGDVSLSGVLDVIRITTVNGTDTFDAGSINIMYE